MDNEMEFINRCKDNEKISEMLFRNNLKDLFGIHIPDNMSFTDADKRFWISITQLYELWNRARKVTLIEAL